MNPRRILFLLAIIKLILPFILHHSFYQLHRDEYLYLAEGHHPAWGYLEVPALLPLLANITNHLGGSFFWVKFWPDLLGAFTLWLIGDLVIKQGGKSFAVLLASLPILLGGYMRLFFLLHPNFLDVFFWTMMAYALFNYKLNEKNKWLYLFGIAMGLGMQSKYSVSFYALGLIAGLLITGSRTIFLNKHFYFAGLIAFIIFLPNLLWQYNHNFPIVKHMQELQEEQLQFINPVNFLISQLLMNLPFAFIWIAGLLFPIVSPEGKKYRLFVWAYLFVIALLVWQHGKDYYALGAYPVLFALGAFWLEKITLQIRWLRFSMVVLPVALAVCLMPIVMPVYEPVKLATFYEKMGIKNTGTLHWEDQKDHPLPQDFADMIGWREMTEQCAKVFHALPVDEQKRTMVFARGYFTAAALNYYGKKYSLPEVYSDNASFLFWMPVKYNINNLLLVGHRFPEKDDKVFQQFKYASIKDSVNMPMFREDGMKFMLFEQASDSCNPMIEKGIAQLKDEFNRH
jgi:hypothetical protein